MEQTSTDTEAQKKYENIGEGQQQEQKQEDEQNAQQQNRNYIPQCKEDFDQPQFKELAFKNNWVIWEKFQKDSDYSQNLCEIAAFNDVISFWQVWNSLPHSNLCNLFYNRAKSVQKVFKLDGVEKQIDSINVFKLGIKPEWEDKKNTGGTSFNWKIPENLGLQQATKEWLKLTLLVVTESDLLSEVDKINGIRVVDKKKIIKIQIWCNIDKQKDKQKIDVFKRELEAQFKIKELNCFKITI